MPKPNTKFAFSVGVFMPEIIPAQSLTEAIEKLPKRMINWGLVEWRDNNGEKISIQRETFDESGWSIQHMIEDWITFSNPLEREEPIVAMKPRGRWNETIEL